MKKQLVSLALTLAMLITLVQSGILGVDAHADALGLKPYSGWFSTGKAGTKDLIRKVCNLSKIRIG